MARQSTARAPASGGSLPSQPARSRAARAQSVTIGSAPASGVRRIRSKGSGRGAGARATSTSLSMHSSRAGSEKRAAPTQLPWVSRNSSSASGVGEISSRSLSTVWSASSRGRSIIRCSPKRTGWA